MWLKEARPARGALVALLVAMVVPKARAQLLGTESINTGTAQGVTNIWSITPGGGPDTLLPASPFVPAATSGIVRFGSTLLTSTGRATIPAGIITTHDPATGAPMGFRDDGVGANAIPGLDIAPSAAAQFGFTPGHVYATADIGAQSPSDVLIDLGPGGAGPDAIVGALRDNLNINRFGVDGISFNPTTGRLYGGTGGSAFSGAPHLVDLTPIGTGGGMIDVGELLVGGLPAGGTLAGLQWLDGTLYGSLGSGQLGGPGAGDLIVIPSGRGGLLLPSSAFLDHTVTVGGLGGNSLTGLALPEPATVMLLIVGGIAVTERRLR